MNKFILLLVSIISINCSLVLSQPAAYGVWNNVTTGLASFGTINIGNAFASSKLILDGYTFVENATSSSYNPTTGLITSITKNIENSQFYLTTVDTNSWTIFNNSFIYSMMEFSNLAFDNTDSEYNLYATYTNGDGNLYVCKLSTSQSYYKAIDTISNVYSNATATYYGSSQLYVVCYVNSTSKWNCNFYSMDGSIAISNTYSISNLASGWVTTSSAYYLTYLPNQKSIIAGIDIQESYHSGEQMFWLTSSSFYNSGWLGSTQWAYADIYYKMFGDFSLPSVYQFCHTVYNGKPGYTMYTYSTYNNQWIRTTPANVGVLNAWGYQ